MCLLICPPLISRLILPIVHHFLSVSSITPSSICSLGEGRPTFHRRRYKLMAFISWYALKIDLLTADMQWRIHVDVAFVDPVPFRVCLLNCCCILLRPCNQIGWKMLLSFHLLEWVTNTMANSCMRHTGILYCSSNKQPHTGFKSGGETGGNDAFSLM